MKLTVNTIRPIAFGDNAYRAADAWHRHIGMDLADDIAAYLRNGWWLLSTPQMFALVCVINIAPENLMICESCGVERADYEGEPDKYLPECPNCGSNQKPFNPVEPAWFIRYSRGNLLTLLQTLSLHGGYFPYTLFCRNNEGSGAVLRKWKTERLVKLAIALNKRAKISGFSNGASNLAHSPVDRAGSIPAVRNQGEKQWAAR